jgi:thiol-disulfide isomerase/thioredoxin
MVDFQQFTRRTLVSGMAAGLAMPHVARAQAADAVKLSLEFRIYGGNAPSFLAIENGIYKKLGLDVTPEGSSGSGECVTRVAAGTHPFGLADASALVEFAARNPSASPKLVMPIFDIFPAVILSIKKKITSLKDLAGLKLGTGTSDAGVKIGEFATGDQRILLNFWASWCIPCRDEIPLLAAYELEAAPQAVIVGVLYQDEAGPAAEAAVELGATWSTLLDPDGVIREQIPVNAAPFTLLLDASGVVLDYRVGPFATLEEIRAFVNAP